MRKQFAIKKLRQVLKDSGATYREAGAKTGINHGHYANMLAGARPISDDVWMKVLGKVEGLTDKEIKALRKQVEFLKEEG